ncbi:MAG: hypothetical protein LAP39_24645 [Acidobacteriia bacterium]|nr:hypothetical protein [Terriglobia bacterium]
MLWLLLSSILNALVTPSLAGNLGDQVQYVGGTISVLSNKTEGFVDTRQDDVFLFQTKKITVQIPYDKINELEYGQRVGRRYAEAILISPVFLLSKTRKHFLTVGFIDDQGRQQAMVFQVGKNEVRSMLVVLEARSGRRVEYQDDDARRSGKG